MRTAHHQRVLWTTILLGASLAITGCQAGRTPEQVASAVGASTASLQSDLRARLAPAAELGVERALDLEQGEPGTLLHALTALDRKLRTALTDLTASPQPGASADDSVFAAARE